MVSEKLYKQFKKDKCNIKMFQLLFFLKKITYKYHHWQMICALLEDFTQFTLTMR